MDQVKSQTVQAETKDHKPNMTSLETYQRRWEQLMEDTEKQLQKIREEEQARKSNQTSSR